MTETSHSPIDDSAPPPNTTSGAPVRELYPAMDARFILVEIGKLLHEGEAHTKAIEKLTDKIGSLDSTVRNAALTGKLILGMTALGAGALWWIGARLWPLREKLLAIIAGS
jgi:hypothetical protein